MDAKGNIEAWLQRLVDGMQDTVKQNIKRAVRNVLEMRLEDFIFGNPAQVGFRICWLSMIGLVQHWCAYVLACLLALNHAHVHTRTRTRAHTHTHTHTHIHTHKNIFFADLAAGHPVPVDCRHAECAVQRQDRQEHHVQEHEEGALVCVDCVQRGMSIRRSPKGLLCSSSDKSIMSKNMKKVRL